MRTIPFPGHEETHLITESGDVYEIASGEWLPRSVTSKGYCSVSMPGGKLSVARAVLEAFVGPPPAEKSKASHINDDPTNNHWMNLKWQ